MGFFKSLKKAFKKVTSGIKKVVKKAVRGVKKVVKKIASSKLLKAIAIAAAIYITGGAAISAFSGGTATGWAGAWASGATNIAAGTGLTATGAAAGTWTAAAQTAAGYLATPFAAAGTFLGNTAAAVTDFTGITTEAGRHGVESIAYDPVNQGFLDIKTGKAVTEQSLMDTGLNQAYVDSMKTTGSYINKSGAIVRGGDALVTPVVKETFATKHPLTSSFLAGAAATTGSAILSGYIGSQFQEDPRVSPSGKDYEGASRFNPLQIYAAEEGIDYGDMDKYFTFNNIGDTSNMPLFQQQTIGIT
tara:strand:- start:2133 stop:3041 length:909 start_codon:yes stop_codon:yes gene_type:complete